MTAERSLTHGRMNPLIPLAAPARPTSDAAASSTLGQPMSDDKPVRRLNARYIHAHLTGDIVRYQARLADDFVCLESDGRILHKREILGKIASGSDLVDYRLSEVDVRCYGDFGLVRATGFWTAKIGMRGTSRYTDVYVWIKGECKVVSAQITRLALGRRRREYAAN
jgi:hypothetical protein